MSVGRKVEMETMAKNNWLDCGIGDTKQPGLLGVGCERLIPM